MALNGTEIASGTQDDKKVLNLRKSMISLVRYLNTENSQKESYTCHLDDVNDDEVRLLNVLSSRLSNPKLDFKIKSLSQVQASLLFLGSLKAFGDFTPMTTDTNGHNHLKLVFSSLDKQDVEKLIKLIKEHTFSKIDIAIQVIDVDVMHDLLEAIAEKENVAELNMAIPNYNCNSMEALRNYLKTYKMQPVPSWFDRLSTYMEQALSISDGATDLAYVIGQDTYNRGATYLNQLSTRTSQLTSCMPRFQPDPEEDEKKAEKPKLD